MLNPDGTVNLRDAEHALAVAERNCTAAFAESRRAEIAVRCVPSYRIEHGRALVRLDVARSNADGALEAVKRARGAVHEALNPELA
jgi:hypothetical protein